MKRATRGGHSGSEAQASDGRGFSCGGARIFGTRASQVLAHGVFFAPQHVSSSQTGDQIWVPCTGRQILNHWTARKVLHLRILNPQKRWQRIHTKKVVKIQTSFIHQIIPLTRALIFSGHKDDEELKPRYLHWTTRIQALGDLGDLHGAVLKMKLDPQPSSVYSQLSALELKARHQYPRLPHSSTGMNGVTQGGNRDTEPHFSPSGSFLSHQPSSNARGCPFHTKSMPVFPFSLLPSRSSHPHFEKRSL